MAMNDHELQAGSRSAWWGAFGNLALTILKITVGVLGHSRALIADGVHSGADVVASLAVVVGLRVSRRPPDEGHNYGHAKAEAVAQKVVALFLILAGFELGDNAVRAFGHAIPAPPSRVTLVVAGLVAAVKVVMYVRQRKVALATGSHSLMAQALDSRMDVISSLVATVAIVGAMAGLPHFDAIGALVVAGLVAWLGIEIFSQAANDLMDRAADPEQVDRMIHVALEEPGVRLVNEMRTRVSGTYTLVDVEIEVASTLSLVEAHRIAHSVKTRIMQLPRIQDVMVHVNPEASSEDT